MRNWTGTRVLILGAARQGLALTRYLVRHGARVTLSDRGAAEALSEARAALADLPVRWALGGHPLELLDETDVLCISGGVPVTIPIVVEAQKRGILLTNDTQVFMEAVPCKTVGITGSAGKTTTTTLVGRMAQETVASSTAPRPRSVYVGGNIGDPLLNYVDEMTPDDLAILEISSFQLEQMTLSPNVAAVLNVTPNHLDRHATMEAYTAAKRRILEFQTPDDIAILGRDDPGAWGMRGEVKGRLLSFGLSRLADGYDGTYMQDGLYHLRDGNAYVLLPINRAIHLPGDHNRLNILAAVAIGHAAGLKLDAMLEAIDSFHGVPHRLELVREWRGAKWINDSIATAPERTIAAIRSFEAPLVLLLGGRDKDLPWGDLADLVHQRVDHVILFGEAAGIIEKALGGTGGRLESITRCDGLRQAVQEAAGIVEPGDVVLLSPGGTSFDEFKDFAARGESFRTWVQELS